MLLMSCSFEGDLTVDDGRITAIVGKLGADRRVIDATGLIVSPGFVDIHNHLGAQIVGIRSDAGELARRHHRVALTEQLAVEFERIKASIKALVLCTQLGQYPN